MSTPAAPDVVAAPDADDDPANPGRSPDDPGRVAGLARSLGQLFVAKKAAMIKLKGVVASKVRYVAYSSDVGEAFRPVVSDKIVKATYGLAISYVCVDVGFHVNEAHKAGLSPVRAGLHASLFQGLASLAIPMVIIHQSVHFVQNRVKNNPNPRIKMWAPTIIGLALIPGLPFLCDEPVEYVIDYVFDKAWPEEGSGHGVHDKPGEAAAEVLIDAVAGGEALIEEIEEIVIVQEAPKIEEIVVVQEAPKIEEIVIVQEAPKIEEIVMVQEAPVNAEEQQQPAEA